MTVIFKATDPKQNRKSRSTTSSWDTSPQIPVAAIFSFLKETSGMDTWTTRDLAATLRITTEKASAVLPFLTMQGYVREAGPKSEWMTTMAGANVSGSSAPHFLRESVERALASLADRMKQFNKSSDSTFEIKNAVGFGDFLRHGTRVQAADVGILLNRRSSKNTAMDGHTGGHTSKQALLKSLRNSSSLLHLCLYQDGWGPGHTGGSSKRIEKCMHARVGFGSEVGWFFVSVLSGARCYANRTSLRPPKHYGFRCEGFRLRGGP
jgi:hypothetical protein